MDLNDRELLREKMIEHYYKPKYKFKSETRDILEVKSDVCQDRAKVYIDIEAGIIKKISFEGEGCAIAMASCDVICQTLEGKSKQETLNIIENYSKMLQIKEYNPIPLEELVIFHQVGKQKSRVICANMVSSEIINFLK